MRATHRFFVTMLLAAFSLLAQNPAQEAQVREAFQNGEASIQRGDLPGAEKAFLKVLSLAPGDIGAHVNLGVVYMREQKWQAALAQLKAAEKRAPNVAGIHLNIGLAYYRQAEYKQAIPAFEAVLRNQPDSTQARHLLGLCYLFELRYSDAARTLEPLWDKSNSDLSYLYALSIAAAKSGRKSLDDRALSRLLEVGHDSPTLHLLLGKAHLAHEEDDQAFEEFQKAASGDPRLPMLHYHLGVIYRRKRDLNNAKQEFLKDIALEPNVAYDYDQLGAVCALLEQYGEAKSAFERAVRLDPKLGTSWYGLAKIAKQDKQFDEALRDLKAAGDDDPKSPSVHYLRAQILAQLGRRAESNAELSAMRQLQQEKVSSLEEEISGKYRDPQMAESQAGN